MRHSREGTSLHARIGLWDSEPQATAAVQTAADGVRANIADTVESVQNHVGDVSFVSMAGR